MSGPAPKPVIDRLFARVAVDAETGCWNWTGASNRLGYGRIRLGSRTNETVRTELVHRVCYELHEGPIPDGLQLDHLCRNPSCCNPEHLEPVSHRENILRGIAPSAQNAIKTHCKHGHEFTPENTLQLTGGGRWCRACGSRRSRESAARRQADGV